MTQNADRSTGALPVTAERQVPPDWADANGHMNEAHYLVVAAGATDRFLELIGAGADYLRSGRSFFTVETHIRYLAEVLAGDRLTVTTQVLRGEGRKLHLFHRLHRGDGMLAATVETLLLHTDLDTRRSSPPDARIAEAIGRFAATHSGQPAEGAGRFVGEKPSRPGPSAP
ncbi:Acyl-CoA thioesterase FadM [Paracoccus halophilus]|uniref:Acyl-CoA thioesterase FadM n=1 Tax=Paracoccus halophilus TaxID=376733 RepID=A0A1I0TLX9_9RHOB|nr:thioesterase family protein [Paracoccus halophilus]SFA52792.1 Acyl-CoA thioesterase FadM [Paracoccus halophilus]